MRVLYYVPHYLARSERFMWQQARDLPGAHVAALQRLPTADEFLFDELSIIRPQGRILRSVDYRAAKLFRGVDTRRTKLTPVESIRLARLAAGSDLIYTMFLWNAFHVLPAARMTRKPLVVHAAGSDVTTAETRGPEYLELVRRVLDRADLVLCGSLFLRSRVLALGADPDRCELHYLGIDMPASGSRTVATSGPVRVVAVSRLDPVKGVDQSLRSFALALGGTNASMTIVGSGPERGALQRLAEDLGIDDNVTFRGELPHAAVYDILANETDIFVQHNVTTSGGAAEGLGGTLLEAGAHALPVIATTSGGASEAVVDLETGFVVDENDVESMARRLGQLASDAELRQKMGQAGRVYVERRHNAMLQNERLGERLAALVEEVR